MRKIFLLAVLAFILGFLFSPAQATMYANQVINIGRGDTSIGNFPGYYGGQYPGNFPVQLSLAQAEAAVLGAPDTTFLSLPGMNGTTSFINYPYAFVQVGFASNFSANNFLEITELGASQESARVWVFTTDGSNVQFDVTRNGIDTISVDLSPYAGFMNMHGGAVDRKSVV